MSLVRKSNTGKYGLVYHIVPPYGLMNDPNGLIYFKGQYHVFFQWNPTDTKHANKHWGHLVSDDMIQWKRVELALAPDQWFDKSGVYSGSAYVHNDQLWLFYTGNVKDEEGNASSYQCLAVSEDGIHFEKKGPLFEHPKGYTRHVRDPKVWYDSRVDHYWMVVGAQTEDLKGDTLVYRSEDLLHWVLNGSISVEEKDFGYMWECPDVIPFEEKDAFIYSPQGIEAQGERFNNLYQTVVQLGQFTIDGKFVVEEDNVTEVDAGFDYYAPQSFQAEDGRILQYGWMGIPEGKEGLIPTIQDGWIHTLTIPREVSVQNGKYLQKPARELWNLTTDVQKIQWNATRFESVFSSPAQVWTVNWKEAVQDKLTIQLRNEISIQYDAESQVLSVSRTDWETGEKETRERTLQSPLKHLNAWMDYSSLELFVNEGEEVFTLRFFTEEDALDFIIQQTIEQEMAIEVYCMKESGFIVE